MEYIKRNYMSNIIFTFLSFTWGLPLTLVGAIVALTLPHCKRKKHGYCLQIEVGEKWGGLNLGYFCFVCKNAPLRTRNHEFGHAIQNCYYGIFTPFIVTIPSAIRYWYRVIRLVIKKPVTTPYDAIWFEHQATVWGNETMHLIGQ